MMKTFLWSFLFSAVAFSGLSHATNLPVVSGETDFYEFAPVEVWHYGQGAVIDGDACIFSNLYNNGFTVQVFERNEQIRGFNIDFGQDTFRQGQFYPFILFVNGNPTEVRGLAKSPSSIRFDLTQPVSTKQFQESGSNSIKIRTEDSEFRLSLTGINNVLKDINGCEKKPETVMAEAVPKPVNTEELIEKEDAIAESKLNEIENEHAPDKNQKEHDHPIENPMFPQPKETIEEEVVADVKATPPNEFEKVSKQESIKTTKLNTVSDDVVNVKDKKVVEQIRTKEDKSEVKLATSEKADKNPVDLAAQKRIDDLKKQALSNTKWQAKKEERLSEVISRWADIADVSIEWEATDDPKMTSDFSFDGNFNDAVNVLLKTNSVFHKNGFAAMAPEKQPAGLSRVQEWRALKGMDLRIVLSNWAEKAGAELIWETGERFKIQSEYKNQSTFPDAVVDILNKFSSDGDDIRPVAELNKDPRTGDLALIIKLEPVIKGTETNS